MKGDMKVDIQERHPEPIVITWNIHLERGNTTTTVT